MSGNSILRTGKNMAMLLTGTVARMVASFAFVLYSAAILGVEAFGKFTIAVHYFELFLSLSGTAAAILLTRDIARWPRRGGQLLASAMMLSTVLALLAPAVMYVLALLMHYSTDTTAAIMIASVALVPATLCVVLEAVFVALERAEFVTIGTGVEALLRLPLSFAALLMGYDFLSLIWILLAVRCVLLLVYMASLTRVATFRIQFSPRATYRFVRRWRIFAMENWMATIYTSLDVLMLSWIAGEVATGLYSAAWKVVRLGTVVAKSYTTAVFPVMSRLFNQSQEKFTQLYRHSIRAMCTVAFPVIAVVSVLPDRVIGLLYNDEFDGAAAVLQVLIWVLLIEFLNPFLSHTLFAQGRQHRCMQIAAASLAVNLVATYLLVHLYGPVGAALGTLLAGGVATLGYLMFATGGKGILQTTVAGLRVVPAAIGLAAVIYQMRGETWLVLGIVSVAVYGCLLFIVGALTLKDVRQMRNILSYTEATT